MENINDLMPLSNDWNNERLTQLKHLFPDLFTNEGKLNIEELKKVVDPASVSETERYEFRWFGKSDAKRNAFTPSNATLMLDEGRSVNATESENIIIEGENLEALKLLSATENKLSAYTLIRLTTQEKTLCIATTLPKIKNLTGNKQKLLKMVLK